MRRISGGLTTLADFVPTDSSEATRLATARQELRDMLARSYTFVQSRHALNLALVRSVDDYRNMELEQIEGPDDPRNRLITHVDRRLSDKERVEEIRNGIHAVADALRSDSNLEVETT